MCLELGEKNRDRRGGC